MNRQILRLAIPNILSTLTVPLLGIVDTILMGHLKNPNNLAGIALGGLVFSLIYMVFGFLRMSTTGLTAQAYGQKDLQAQANMLGRALFLTLLLSALVLLFQNIISLYNFNLLN